VTNAASVSMIRGLLAKQRAQRIVGASRFEWTAGLAALMAAVALGPLVSRTKA
jgi:hypothetical protein